MSGAGNSHGLGLSATATAGASTSLPGGAMSGSAAKTRRKSRRPPRQLKFVPPPRDLPEALLHFCPLRSSPPAAEEAESTTTATVGGTAFSPPQELSAAPRLVNVMTEGLLDLFHACNPAFHYDRRLNPRRVLTKPSKPTYNSGYDNEKHDYILYVNDIMGNEEGHKYVILDLLGQGTFGQVVKCQRLGTRELVAVKVIKNQTAFFNQSMMEVTVLEMLNQRYDKDDRHHIVRMRDTFVFRQHLCIVVELLSLNLYELIKQNQYRGFSLTLCRIFLQQILDALKVLKEARIIHCDLKPENILLRSLESPAVKVIDYGSACHEHQTLYTYIQSRFYRSPEVLLGLPYSASIDMWSLGCIAAELFLGLPIFPGASNYDQISRIVQTLGNPPNHMLEVGKDTLNYFERSRPAAPDRLDRSLGGGGGSGGGGSGGGGSGGGGGVSSFQLKSRERYNLVRICPVARPHPSVHC